eukprot:107393-Rhodomonas_salina.1
MKIGRGLSFCLTIARWKRRWSMTDLAAPAPKCDVRIDASHSEHVHYGIEYTQPHSWHTDQKVLKEAMKERKRSLNLAVEGPVSVLDIA